MRFTKQTFEKHQGKLLWIANSKLFGWLLGMNRLPKPLKDKKIYKIFPNAIVTRTSDIETYHFFVRPRFAEALAFNLSPIPAISVRGKLSYRFSPVGLAFGALFGYFGGFGIIGATDTYTEAGDGVVYISNASWDTAHNAVTGDAFDYTGDDALDCWTGKESDGRYRIGRGFAPFDTSPLTAQPTIGTFYIYKKDGGIGDADAQAYLRVVDQAEGAKNGQASTATLAAADFDECGAVDNPAALATDAALSGISTGAYTSFVLNATGLAAIDIAGNTLLGIREGHDVEDAAYAGANNTLNSVRFYTSQRAGSSEDPYLSTSIGVEFSVSDTISISESFKGNQDANVNDTVSLSDSISVLRGIAFLVQDTISIAENFLGNLTAKVSSAINLSDNLANFRLRWEKRTELTTSYSNRSKPTTSFSGRSKPTTSFTNRTKPN